MGKDQCRATLPEGPGGGWRCLQETGHPGWHRDCRGIEWRSGRNRRIKRRTPTRRLAYPFLADSDSRHD